MGIRGFWVGSVILSPRVSLRGEIGLMSAGQGRKQEERRNVTGKGMMSKLS
jgi:hypothetical protein